MINKDTKVLVTGCGGMLGEAVFKEFNTKSKVLATDIDLNESWLSLLDVRSKEDVQNCVKQFKPDAIIHLAALTDMEFCELNFENSYKTNSEATLFLSREAEKNNIPFVYISTAGIFDGTQEYYSEEDLPNPLSTYGRSKYFGELAAKSIPKSIVIRAGWMMGGGPKKDKKFINKIIKQIRDGKKEIFAVSDKLGVPCYTYDLAKSIYYLLDKGEYGIFHGACDGEASRYEVAQYLLKSLDLKDKIHLKEVDSSFFTKDYFAPRPFSEKLVNNKLKKLNPNLTRGWEECLKEYVNMFNWGL